MTELQQIIESALARHRLIRKQRFWLAALAAFAVVMVIASSLDHRWIFHGWTRWIGWIAGLLAAAGAVRLAAGATSPDATALAHEVEKQAGETAPVVATAIDPAARQTAQGEALGKVMLERLDHLAAGAIRKAPPTFRGRLRGPAVFLSMAMAGLAALVALQGTNGLLRMMIPWLASPYTNVTLEGPMDPPAAGKPFVLTARVSGVPAKTVVLCQVDSPQVLAEAAVEADGSVALAVNGIDTPADFVVKAGDGRSDPLRVTPYPLPSIASFEIAIIPPEYAARTAGLKTTPSFSALRGSKLDYKIRLKAPAASVQLERNPPPPREERLSAEEQAKLKLGLFGQRMGVEDPSASQPRIPVFRPDPADPLVWHADWDVSSDQDDIIYRLAIKGGRGDLVRNQEPWRINLVKDSPPVVRIESHDGGEVIRFGIEDVRFNLSASDDVALTAARLVFRKPGQPHTKQAIKLPAGTGRNWSGAEILALAPMDLKPLEIIAVHAEADDANAIDGAGTGRSEVVYLEVPLPESDDSGGGGGGGGNGPPPVNPLELQMEILKATVVLPDSAPAADRQTIAHDQRQNAEYVAKMLEAAAELDIPELVAALARARRSMELAADVLDKHPAVKAVPQEEAAIGGLVDAAKVLEKEKEKLQAAALDGEGKMTFTLSRPKPKSSSAGDQNKKNEEQRETLRKLMKEVQRQLAEQQKLNQSKAEAAARAAQQQALSQDAQAAAGQAEKIKPSTDGRGDPKEAAKALEQAAALEKANAEAIAGGDAEANKRLGEQSEQALAKALREISAQMGSTTTESEAYPPGYERLVEDYLRSISYE